jgi:hypothetical protein
MFPEFLCCARPGIEMVQSMHQKPQERQVRATLHSRSICVYEQKMARGAHKAQPLAGL